MGWVRRLRLRLLGIVNKKKKKTTDRSLEFERYFQGLSGETKGGLISKLVKNEEISFMDDP